MGTLQRWRSGGTNDSLGSDPECPTSTRDATEPGVSLTGCGTGGPGCSGSGRDPSGGGGSAGGGSGGSGICAAAGAATAAIATAQASAVAPSASGALREVYSLVVVAVLRAVPLAAPRLAALALVTSVAGCAN